MCRHTHTRTHRSTHARARAHTRARTHAPERVHAQHVLYAHTPEHTSARALSLSRTRAACAGAGTVPRARERGAHTCTVSMNVMSPCERARLHSGPALSAHISNRFAPKLQSFRRPPPFAVATRGAARAARPPPRLVCACTRMSLGVPRRMGGGIPAGPLRIAYDDSTACERRAAEAAGGPVPRGCHSGEEPPEGVKVRLVCVG